MASAAGCFVGFSMSFIPKPAAKNFKPSTLLLVSGLSSGFGF
jgi:hypothetical protein